MESVIDYCPAYEHSVNQHAKAPVFGDKKRRAVYRTLRFLSQYLKIKIIRKWHGIHEGLAILFPSLSHLK